MKKYDYIMQYIQLERHNPIGASRYAPIETSFNKGYIYEVDSYDNKIDDFDKNGDRIYNYLEWVD